MSLEHLLLSRYPYRKPNLSLSTYRNVVTGGEDSDLNGLVGEGAHDRGHVRDIAAFEVRVDQVEHAQPVKRRRAYIRQSRPDETVKI